MSPSDALLRSREYLRVLAAEKPLSRRLYAALIEESADLVRALSEIGKNYHKQTAFTRALAERRTSLKKKRELLLNPRSKSKTIQLARWATEQPIWPKE